MRENSFLSGYLSGNLVRMGFRYLSNIIEKRINW